MTLSTQISQHWTKEVELGKLYLFPVQRHCNIVRQLASHRQHNPSRLFALVNVHHGLERDLVKVEAVAHVVVGAHCLWVVVHHDGFASILKKIKSDRNIDTEDLRSTNSTKCHLDVLMHTVRYVHTCTLYIATFLKL